MNNSNFRKGKQTNRRQTAINQTAKQLTVFTIPVKYTVVNFSLRKAASHNSKIQNDPHLIDLNKQPTLITITVSKVEESSRNSKVQNDTHLIDFHTKHI
jgi:hypothetical protein